MDSRPIHPLNLTLRFILELAALFAMAYWGWTQHSGFWRILLTPGLPVVALLIWGTFAVPGDPSRSGRAPIPTPGIIRLLLELAFFGLGALCAIKAGQPLWGWVLAGAALIHYLIAYPRITWLLKQ